MKPIGSSKSRNGVFISYARGDGEAFATDLRRRLEAEKIALWQDRVGMEGGRDWWLQITDALDQVEFMALVITPKALASPIVRKEWRYARQQGVCVYPVIGAKGLDYGSLPRWMRSSHFYDLDHQWERFLNDLRTRCETPRVPFMVDDMPEDFVERPGEFDQLLDLLLTPDREDPVAITAALRGAGGFGKTALARALCHNDDVQNAFDDGILWVTLGETPGDLTPRVEGLIHSLTGERPGFTSLEAAITRFRELIEERDLLIVIDDVWNQSHLRPFLQGGKRCARLITTRNLDTLPTGAQKVTVDAMQPSEARALLGKGLEGEPDFEDAVHDLDFLSSRLGEWPLLLKLVNGFLRKAVEYEHRTIRDALVRANKALDKKGLVYFDVNRSDDRNDAVARTIEISLEWLTPDERNRYFELAVFPEDIEIPLKTVFRLWSKTGGLEEFDSEDLISKLNGLSLLLNFDASRRIFQLHDVIRHYLISARIGEMQGLHAALIDSHRPSFGWSELPEDEPYLWDHLAEHLVEAGLGQELVSTVKDWRYLVRKTLLKKSSTVERDLIRAEAVAPEDDTVSTLRRSFANSGHIFNHCENRSDLKSTIYTRLRHLEDLKKMIDDLGEQLDYPRIESRFTLPDLPHPALIRTIEGHSSVVHSCAFSPDGNRIVSASSDSTLKLWDASSGDLLRTFEGHSDGVLSCAFSPDGNRIVSASSDRTHKLWDATTGDLLRTFEGHSNWVRSCAFSPDG
ncbi:MAG: TIR domain-containing protein, partial [Blastocatellales bacterium]